jgi:hypothetical protein
MSPTSRTVVALTLMALTGLVLSALLIHGALDRLRLRAAESNIDFVLTQLRDAVEASVSLGLDLADIPIAQDLIERARYGNADILAVEIFSNAGVSLYNTDRGSIGEPISDEWREAIRLRDEGHRWRLESLGAIVVGEQIHNDFGETVGELAVTLSGASTQAHAAALMATLAEWLAVIALPVVVVIAVLSALLIGHATRDLRAVTRLLDGVPSTPRRTTESGAELREMAEAMRDTISVTIDRVDTAADAVRALDEDEERYEPA